MNNATLGQVKAKLHELNRRLALSQLEAATEADCDARLDIATTVWDFVTEELEELEAAI